MVVPQLVVLLIEEYLPEVEIVSTGRCATRTVPPYYSYSSYAVVRIIIEKINSRTYNISCMRVWPAISRPRPATNHPVPRRGGPGCRSEQLCAALWGALKGARGARGGQERYVSWFGQRRSIWWEMSGESEVQDGE